MAPAQMAGCRSNFPLVGSMTAVVNKYPMTDLVIREFESTADNSDTASAGQPRTLLLASADRSKDIGK